MGVIPSSYSIIVTLMNFGSTEFLRTTPCLFMLFMAATTFTLTRCSRTNKFRSRRAYRAKTYCATDTEG